MRWIFFGCKLGDTPDYCGLVDENGEVDSLVPSDEFLREHGEIETLIRSHDYDFEFESLNPLRPFSSLADSKLRRTSFHPKLKRERSHSIKNPMKSSSEIFDSESKLSHISTYVDSPRSWAMRSQGAVRVKKHSKLMSPMMRSRGNVSIRFTMFVVPFSLNELKNSQSEQKTNTQSKTQTQVLLPTRFTDDMERRPQISRHSRRSPQTQYQIAEKPSKQVKVVSTVRSIESDHENILSDSVERAPRVGRPRNVFTKSKRSHKKMS